MEGSEKERVGFGPTYFGGTLNIADDLTFEVVDAFGAQRISLASIPPGWAIKAIQHDGRDYADAPLQVRHGQRYDNVVVVLSRNLPTLRGTLTDERGQPASGVVILFPEDEAKWAEGTRLVRSARPDQAGGFEMRLVPAGDYLVAGIEYARDGDWRDPAFLEALRDGAKRVTLKEGAGAEMVALVLKPRPRP
jgi:hypothetical protein